MASIRRYRSSAPRVTSIVMLVGMVYQWGGCPCGCLEHNAWLEMLGVSSHEHVTLEFPQDSDSQLASAEDHDCTGRPRPVYVGGGDGPLRWLDRSVSLERWDALASAATLAADCGRFSDERGPPPRDGSGAARAVLQVFRL